MRADCVNIGETIKALRNAKNISREQLSEMTGISRSHLEKIESGVRRPGIDAYYKIMDVLGVEMVMKAESKSIQEKCIVRAQEIFMNSTENQAAFMIHVLESMAEKIDALT
jgi:transcriptional regulator with XRE-family HTH domain